MELDVTRQTYDIGGTLYYYYYTAPGFPDGWSNASAGDFANNKYLKFAYEYAPELKPVIAPASFYHGYVISGAVQDDGRFVVYEPSHQRMNINTYQGWFQVSGGSSGMNYFQVRAKSLE